ncbi:MAG: TIGR01777 family oxidoreductase [Actinobacteria bacterium]|nr:TIGR01777 family oxidoreductase [Actinomycetota bacterium]
MRILLAGASGFIGSALHRSLASDGHDVRVLVRRAPTRSNEIEWHPDRAELASGVTDGCDVVVCLSGAGVGARRWSDEYKQVILSSRIEPVSTLARSVAGSGTPLICASAVGYYGDTGDRIIDESAPSGDSFLALVCRQWESAAATASDAGSRVAHLRTGLVLGSGGLLAQLLPVFKLGAGGRLGDGRQWMPWISLTDEIRAIRHVIEQPDLAGPVNLTGPAPVTNREFSAVLGRVLRRPAVMRVPALALRATLGEFAGEVLGGQRALPKRLTDTGFGFEHTDLEPALRSALG